MSKRVYERKQSKKICALCQYEFVNRKEEAAKCCVCLDFYYCKSCMKECACFPPLAGKIHYLCADFHPHECAYPDCKTSLCRRWNLDNPMGFGSIDTSFPICTKHRPLVLKRMRHVLADPESSTGPLQKECIEID
jgi:hypothetical protein